MSQRVYFMQPTNGGPIKIGCTKHPQRRLAELSTVSPNGVEFIATIPGYKSRESMLKILFKPWSLNGEWFRSCPELMAIIVEAWQSGDISWLPPEPEKMISGGAMYDAVLREHGSISAAAEALDVKPAWFCECRGNWPSRQLYARVEIRKLALAGALPHYLTPSLSGAAA